MLLLCWPVRTVEPAHAWGFYGHKRINRMACFTLPPEMFPFYKRHIDFISDHAVDPDRRRYAVDGEAQRHYIDIDHYAHSGAGSCSTWCPANGTMPSRSISEDTLQAYGIVPWHIEVMFGRLVSAFQRGDVDRILSNSADIGPLHRRRPRAACTPPRTTMGS